jgi:hypothetical protein
MRLDVSWGIIFSNIPVFLIERLNWPASTVGFFIAFIGTIRESSTSKRGHEWGGVTHATALL